MGDGIDPAPGGDRRDKSGETAAPRSMALNDLVTGVILFVGAALVLAHVQTFPDQAARLPEMVLIFMMACAGLLTLTAARRLRLERGMPRKSIFLDARRFAISVAAMGLYILGIQYLGFYTSTVLFMPAAAYVLGARGKVMVPMTTACFLLFVFLVFDLLLQRPLPPEIWSDPRLFGAAPISGVAVYV